MLNLDKLRGAVTSTFSNRGTFFRPIEFDETSLKAIQRLWAAHLHGLGDNAHDFDLPKDIAAVIEEVNKYVVAVKDVPKIDRT